MTELHESEAKRRWDAIQGRLFVAGAGFAASVLLVGATTKITMPATSGIVTGVWAYIIAAMELGLVLAIVALHDRSSPFIASAGIAIVGVVLPYVSSSPCGCFGSWSAGKDSAFLLSCVLGSASCLAIATRSPPRPLTRSGPRRP